MQIKSKTVAGTIAEVVPFVLGGVQLDFLSRQAITHTQFIVVVAVFSRRFTTMNELAKNMHVTMPTMTGIVDRLEKAGYVSRVRADKDRRQVSVKLSAKGESLIADFQKAVSHRWNELLKDFSSEDLMRFSQVLEKVRRAAIS